MSGALLGMEFHLTPFTEAHIDPAAALFVQVFAAEPWNEVWPLSSSRRRLADIARSPGFLGVAGHRAGELAGFALGRLEVYREEEHYFLQEMCVAPRYQRQGVGKAMLAYLEGRLEERGCSQIYLLTARDSGPEAFYLHCGFSPARRVGVMVKRLG